MALDDENDPPVETSGRIVPGAATAGVEAWGAVGGDEQREDGTVVPVGGGGRGEKGPRGQGGTSSNLQSSQLSSLLR